MDIVGGGRKGLRGKLNLVKILVHVGLAKRKNPPLIFYCMFLISTFFKEVGAIVLIFKRGMRVSDRLESCPKSLS